MEVSEALVERMAKLSRLRLDGPDLERMRGEMERILDYLSLLSELERDEPAWDDGTEAGALREDRVRPSLERELLMANAPEMDGDLFLVPGVLSGEGDDESV